MVFFFLTREGYEDMRAIVGPYGGPVWVNAGIFSDTEVNSLRSTGVDLTCFSSPIDPNDREAIDAALWTIAEHHSGERIFVEIQAGEFAA